MLLGGVLEFVLGMLILLCHTKQTTAYRIQVTRSQVSFLLRTVATGLRMV